MSGHEPAPEAPLPGQRPPPGTRLSMRDTDGNPVEGYHLGCNASVQLTSEASGILATCARCGVIPRQQLRARPLADATPSTLTPAQLAHQRAIRAQDRGASSEEVDRIRRGAASA